MQFSIQTIFTMFVASLAIAKPITDLIAIQDITGKIIGDQLLRRNYNIKSESSDYGFGGRHYYQGHRHGHKGSRSEHRVRNNGVYRRDRGHANYGSRRHLNRI